MQKTITIEDKKLNIICDGAMFPDSKVTQKYLVISYRDDDTTCCLIPEGTLSRITRPFRILFRGTRGRALDFLDKHREKTERTFTLPSKGKKGRIVRSSRLFGIELELTRGGSTIRKEIQSIPTLQLKHDGSVDGEALELTTPPLSGTTAEHVFHNYVDKATKDAKTNRSCGMHIHVDARDYRTRYVEKEQVWALADLVSVYLSLQKFFFSVVPLSRRSNSYCMERDTKDIDRLRGFSDESYTRDYLGVHYGQGSRYYWLNFLPWFREGHYEIRLHGGTRDPRKILEWANIHTGIADAVLRRKFSKQDIDELRTTGSLRALEILTDKLKLSDASVAYWRGRITTFNHQ